jgi:glucose-6-phosphate isomerase
MGADVRGIWTAPGSPKQDCQNFDCANANSGLWPGLALGELAMSPRPPATSSTYVIEPPLESFGLWLEQLVAESTGKQAAGSCPSSTSRSGRRTAYGDDRVIAYYCHAHGARGRAAAVAALAQAGQPVIVREMGGPADLGRLFYFSEFAVATAGWVLGINPFDQPNVQEAKDATARCAD